MKKNVHIMAVCGKAMVMLAGMLKDLGYDVRGSDANVFPPMSTQLEKLGIPYFEGFQASNLDWKPDLVVVGNMITRANPEAVAMQERGLEYTSFPKMLAEVLIRDRHAIVVAGTHGKTTTSAALAWTLSHAGADPGFMVAGVMRNFERAYSLGTGEYVVVEGDEYDTAYFDKVPKFIHYRPRTGLLTSVEFDHADIYADLASVKREFRRFVGLIPPDGLLVAGVDDPNVREVIADAAAPVQTYGFAADADWRITESSVPDGVTAFTVAYRQVACATLHTTLIGRHNLLNLLGATAVLRNCGLSFEAIDAGFRTFTGVKNRQEVRGCINNITVIDDFAHHPTAVRETIAAVKAHYFPSAAAADASARTGRLWSVFEPATAATRRDVFQQEYVEAFGQTDVALIADVNRPEKAPEGQRLSLAQMVRDLRERGIDARHISGVDQIVAVLAEQARPGDVILIMSNTGFGGIHDKVLQALAAKPCHT
jgi:UDP-N-acetylmuramate: L-alanyl-gamma-D-glutamyl-meso-diaminopimelate ligase